MDIQFIIAPIVGAIIGFVTNGIAIRMIFRPLYAKYLFGWKLPFTPGLIPKEKDRIAKSIGNAISVNLMNKDVLEKTLLSDDMFAKIEEAIDGFVWEQKKNPESLRVFLYQLLSKDEIDTIILNTKSDLVALLQKEIADPHLGDQVSHIVVEHAIAKVREGLLGLLGIDKFIGLIAIPAEILLAKNINEILANNSDRLIDDLLGKESDRLLSMKMCDIVSERTEQIEQFKAYALSVYKKIITDYLPRILDTLDISQMIENRIQEMDVKEVEKLIFQIMDKELKAIVWLGALLGFLMGFLNVMLA